MRSSCASSTPMRASSGGQEKVDADHTRLWDLRCIWGMKGVLPFGSTVSVNLGELLYVAETVCGYVQTPWIPKTKRGKQ